MWRPMARDAVAAGEGALTTCTAPSVTLILKSSTSEPFGLTACARTPAPPRWISSIRMSGTSFWSERTKAAFVRSLQKLVPDIREGDIARGGAGVRAQAVSPNGSLVDDFRISVTEGAVHVVNAPSPAATASLAIGRHIAGLAADTFRLAT